MENSIRSLDQQYTANDPIKSTPFFEIVLINQIWTGQYNS